VAQTGAAAAGRPPRHLTPSPCIHLTPKAGWPIF
jgi:hypothetical protein